MKHSYNFAKKEELDLIHKYSMRSLEQTGVKFMCREAVEIFASHGFRTEGDTVFMTEADVMAALKTCPRTFEWVGRGSSVTIGGGETICAPSYGPVMMLEDEKYHHVDKRDYLNMAKLNASSKVMHCSNANMMDFNFIPAQYASNWAFATVLMHDTRPAMGMVDGRKNALDSIKMAQEFYGIYDKCLLLGLISIVSPFHYSEAMCEALIEYAKAGQGVYITPSALNSLTVPGSLASMLLVNNTEVLAGIVLTQIINPGTPIIYGNQSHGCDLRYATPSMGCPEQALIFSSVKAFGDYYNIPVRTGGSSCDAKYVDMQAGVESYAMMYATLESGADLMVHSCGSLNSDNALSYDKYIYDEEILLSVLHILRGLEVSEETLCYDQIVEVGCGGTFLDLEDELLDACTEAYRNDYMMMSIPSRDGHGNWEYRGCETVLQRTEKAWKKRIVDYVMPAISDEQLAVLCKYVPKELLLEDA